MRHDTEAGRWAISSGATTAPQESCCRLILVIPLYSLVKLLHQACHQLQQLALCGPIRHHVEDAPCYPACAPIMSSVNFVQTNTPDTFTRTTALIWPIVRSGSARRPPLTPCCSPRASSRLLLSFLPSVLLVTEIQGISNKLELRNKE